MPPVTETDARLSWLPAHGGLVVLVAHVLIAPYGLRDPTSLLASFLQATFFVLLVLVLIGVAAHRMQLTTCILLIVVATVIRVSVSPDARIVHAAADLSLVVCGLVAMWMSMSRLLRVHQVSATLITASVGLYLLSGITWALAFHAVELLWPGSFAIPGDAEAVTAADLYYFSFVTLTTLGYGDISPAIPLARSLAMLEASFGQIFLVALLGRLVSLQITASPWRDLVHASPMGVPTDQTVNAREGVISDGT